MYARNWFAAFLVLGVTLSPRAHMLSHAQSAANATVEWEYKDLDGLFADGGRYDPTYLENARHAMNALLTPSGATLPKLDIPSNWTIRYSHDINDLNQYRELSASELSIKENQIVMLLTSRPLEDTQSGYTTPVQVHDDKGNNISKKSTSLTGSQYQMVEFAVN